MKTRKYALTFGLCLALGLGAAACNDATKDKEFFEATLMGVNEVPPRSTAATGTAGIIVEGDTLHFSIEVENINNVVAAHIHAIPGQAGVNGPVRFPFFAGRTSATGKTILVEGSFGPSNVTGITFAQLLNEMRNGNAYVNVHTTQFPGGEIRGQVRLISVD